MQTSASRDAIPLQRCRSCNEAVRWVVTVAGKRMPLDPDMCPDGNVVFTHPERWYGAWRRYAFFPNAGVRPVFESTCLRDIARFLEEQTAARRRERGQQKGGAHAGAA